MTLITQKEFAKLSNVHDTSCISIFIPTNRSGQAVLQNKDALMLKNQLKEISAKLEERGLSPRDIEETLAPVQELIDDFTFWKHQSDGLAIFLANGFFQEYTLPIKFEAFHYISNEFYLKPLMPLFVGDGRFFILALELQSVNFYEGTRHSITEVRINDLVPSRLEERVGFDYKEKFLQFRSQQGGHGDAIYHGHGSVKDVKKNEIQRYFRAINDGLMTMLHDEYPPMIVASLDYLFPIYKEVNDYNNLMEEHLSCNPADEDKLGLHEKTWELVEPYFRKEQREKFGLFKQFQGTERTSSTTEEIIPAALEGKIDTLFVQNGADIFGWYDPAKRKVEINQEHHIPNVSLMNLAVINTFLQGGKVYLMEKEEMPNADHKMSALFRY